MKFVFPVCLLTVCVLTEVRTWISAGYELQRNFLKDWWLYLHSLITEGKSHNLWRESRWPKWELWHQSTVLKPKIIQKKCKLRTVGWVVKTWLTVPNCFCVCVCVFLCLADLFLKEKNMNHTRSYTSAIIKCYVWVLTFVFDKGTVSGLHDVFYLKWYDYQPLREDREGSWEIKESCVVTVVFPDAGSGPPFRLCRCCIALLLCMVTHIERGWKGNYTRLNVRFLKRWEPPSSAGLFHLWDVSLEAVWLLC